MTESLKNSTLKILQIHSRYYVKYNISIAAIPVAMSYNHTNQTVKLDGYYESTFSNDLKYFEFRGKKSQHAKYNATKYYRVFTVLVCTQIESKYANIYWST